jgi:hypothetical protein
MRQVRQKAQEYESQCDRLRDALELAESTHESETQRLERGNSGLKEQLLAAQARVHTAEVARQLAEHAAEASLTEGQVREKQILSLQERLLTLEEDNHKLKHLTRNQQEQLEDERKKHEEEADRVRIASARVGVPLLSPFMVQADTIRGRRGDHYVQR